MRSRFWGTWGAGALLLAGSVWAAGAPPPPSATEALFAALRTGDLRGARALLDGGADPGGRDGAQQTPLHVAAGRGDWQAISLLMARGADPEARDGLGLSPLHLAVIRGEPEAVAALLARGASPDPRDPYGLTPLHCAALHGAYAVAQILLDRGADALARDKAGLTPADLARGEEKAELAALLKEASRRAPKEAPPREGAGRTYDDASLVKAGGRAHGFSVGSGPVPSYTPLRQVNSGGCGVGQTGARDAPGAAAKESGLRRQLKELQAQLEDLRSHPPEKNTAYGVREGNLTTVYPSSEVRQAYEWAIKDVEEKIADVQRQLQDLR